MQTPLIIQEIIDIIWYIFYFFILIVFLKSVFFILKKRVKKQEKLKQKLKNLETFEEEKNKNLYENEKETKSHENLKDKKELFEWKIGRMFEQKGYKVSYDIKDIDIVCKSTNKKTLLINCTNKTKEKAITQKDIKSFYQNALNYMKEEKLTKSDIELKYIVLKKEVFDITAIKTIMNNHYNCKYIEFDKK